MKKFFAIMIVAMFGFTFGCGGAPVEAPATPETPEADVDVEVPEADIEVPEADVPAAPEADVPAAPEAPAAE